MNDIHDNMLPISLPIFTVWDWSILAGLIIFISVFCVLIWYLRKIKQGSVTPIVETTKVIELPRRQSWDKEFLQLEKLISTEKWKQFCHLSTHLLKLYFSEIQKINMLEKTTEECFIILNQDSSLSDIKQFFNIVDPVKFAGIAGKKEQAETALSILKNVVENSSNP